MRYGPVISKTSFSLAPMQHITTEALPIAGPMLLLFSKSHSIISSFSTAGLKFKSFCYCYQEVIRIATKYNEWLLEESKLEGSWSMIIKISYVEFPSFHSHHQASFAEHSAKWRFTSTSWICKRIIPDKNKMWWLQEHKISYLHQCFCSLGTPHACPYSKSKPQKLPDNLSIYTN